MVEVVALQRTLKEARHNMQVAREFTHERTKQCITHLNALAWVAPMQGARAAMPERSPRLFVQEHLRDLCITEPAFTHCPALLGARPETPDLEQFNSTQEDLKKMRMMP